MRKLIYTLVFLVAMIWFIVVQTPLAWVMARTNLHTTGLSWSVARGNLIKGDLIGISFQRAAGPPIALGSAELSLASSHLPLAQLAYDTMWAAHSGIAQSRIIFKIGGEAEISNLNATVRIEALEGLENALRVPGSTLRILTGNLRWHRKKGCRAGSGVIRSDWVSLFAQKFNETWSDLEGNFQCEGANLRVDLTGTSSRDEAVTITIKVEPTGIIFVDLHLRGLSDNTAILVQNALPDLAPADDGFSYTYRVGG